MVLKNLTQNQILAEKVVEAKTFATRSIGLLGKRHWPTTDTLWIHRCNSIHTFFMKIPIDAVFVDRHLRVQKVIQNIRPWNLILPVWSASSVFEFAADHSQVRQLKEGDQLHVDT